MKAQSLSQRLNWTIVGMTLATLVFSLTFVMAAYSLLFQFAPKLLSAEDAILPGPVEWGIYSVCIVLGGIAASVVATRVARRMVEPLEALAEAAREIAGGDLSARAVLSAPAPTEASQMIADFNAMADRLEKAVDDIVTWNSVIAHELRTPVTILKGRLQPKACSSQSPRYCGPCTTRPTPSRGWSRICGWSACSTAAACNCGPSRSIWPPRSKGSRVSSSGISPRPALVCA